MLSLESASPHDAWFGRGACAEKRRKGEKKEKRTKKWRVKQRLSTQLLHSTHTTQAQQAQSWRTEASQPWMMCDTWWVPAGYPRYHGTPLPSLSGRPVGGSTAQAQPPITTSVRKFLSPIKKVDCFLKLSDLIFEFLIF